MSQTTIYRQRLATVQRWLRESGWTPDDGAQSDPALVERAVAQWYPGRGAAGHERARVLLSKARMMLRGEQVQTAGGRPRKWRRVPVT